MQNMLRDALGLGILAGLADKVLGPKKLEGFEDYQERALAFQEMWERIDEMDYEEGKEYLLQLCNVPMPVLNPLIFAELYDRYELDSDDLTRMLLSKGATLEDQTRAAFTIMNDHPLSEIAKTLSALVFKQFKLSL